MKTAPLIGISRHRLTTDGEGVTTLVAFHGCPLRCKYCHNPDTWANSKETMEMTPQEALEKALSDNNFDEVKVKKDELEKLAQELAVKVYSQAAEAAQAAQGDAGANSSDDSVVDAEYKEV